jgi:predicted nucleotidyltransferase
VSARSTTRERFGITEKSFDLITEAIGRRPEIERAVIFGSRATGNAKHGSDIDLAIYGEKVTPATAESLSRELNERVPIPYYVDVVAYGHTDHEGLKRHIDTEGREFFRRSSAED